MINTEAKIQMDNVYPKSVCGKCHTEVEAVGVGSATGRPYYRCCGVEWTGKNPAAQALGALGGKARAVILTSEQRREQAVDAVNSRWEKRKRSC